MRDVATTAEVRHRKKDSPFSTWSVVDVFAMLSSADFEAQPGDTGVAGRIYFTLCVLKLAVHVANLRRRFVDM